MAQIPLTQNEKGRRVIITLTIFMAVSFFFVFVRFWARRLRKQALELNDWALLAALTFTTGMYITIVAAVVNGGVGLHVMEIVVQHGGMPTIFAAGQLVLAADIMWNLSTLTIKISILHLYISIFGLTSRRFCRIVWAVMGVCITSTAVFIIQVLLLCRPLAFFWDKSLNGKCGSLPLTYLIPGVIITIEDIIVFALPMSMLWKLQTSRKKKFGAMFVFGIGLGICIIAGVRLKYVLIIKEEDFTATIWMFAILGGLEPMLGIISACLPVVPALVAHYSSNRIMFWSTKGGSGGNSTYKRSFGKGMSNSSGGRSEHDNFERLGDGEYPLIDQPNSGTHADVEANSGIHVTKQFTVR